MPSHMRVINYYTSFKLLKAMYIITYCRRVIPWCKPCTLLKLYTELYIACTLKQGAFIHAHIVYETLKCGVASSSFQIDDIRWWGVIPGH